MKMKVTKKSVLYTAVAILLIAIIVLVAHFGNLATFINLWVAIGTLSLALITFFSLKQNERIRKEERREIASETIATWAADGIARLARYLPNGTRRLAYLEMSQVFSDVRAAGLGLAPLARFLNKNMKEAFGDAFKKIETLSESAIYANLDEDKIKTLNEQVAGVNESLEKLIKTMASE